MRLGRDLPATIQAAVLVNKAVVNTQVNMERAVNRAVLTATVNAKTGLGCGLAGVLTVGAMAMLLGCSESTAIKDQAPIKDPPISQRERVEKLRARTDKSFQLSETETIKVVIVPGYPYGDRCVIYNNGATSSMVCREIIAGQQ